MNYQSLYNSIIERARHRHIEGYTEKHHVIPRCLGGTNDKHNLVRLTPKEHYIAHLLLCHIHPTNWKVWAALIMMAPKAKVNGERVTVSAKTYQYARERYGTLRVDKTHTQEAKQKMRERKLNTTKTEEHKRKISESVRAYYRNKKANFVS